MIKNDNGATRLCEEKYCYKIAYSIGTTAGKLRCLQHHAGQTFAFKPVKAGWVERK